MVIVFQMGDEFWIEFLQFPSDNVLAAGNYQETMTLERPGDFLGGSLFNLQDEDSEGRGYILVDGVSGLLTFGKSIISVTCFAVNGSGSASNMQSSCMVFLRKSNG